MTPPDDERGHGLPRLPLSFARVVAPWKRPATATTALPERQTIVTGWRPGRAQLAEYRALIGSSADMPLVFAQVPVMAMTMDLVSKWSFPVRAMGLVHQGAVVEVLDELPADGAWDLRAWGSGGRHVRSGLEFDVWGEVSVAGRVRWRSRAVYLSRSRAASGAEESAVPEVSGDGPWPDEVPLPVTEGTGRAFARVSGDINPIHLHELPARAFGFRRAIAHGWWTAGRTAALLDRDECVAGRTLEIAFRRPVELPSTPLLCSRRTEVGAVEFAVVAPGAESGRALVAGRITG
jgi:acyl dehydratase